MALVGGLATSTQRKPAGFESALDFRRLMHETSSETPSQQAVSWRRNLYAITIAQWLAIVGFTLREPILPFYLKHLGDLSTNSATRWSGLFAAGGGLTMAITAPIWGLVGDKFGRKPMLLRSMIAASITVGLMGLATAPWHIVGLRLVEGAFTGTVTASTALVATSAPKERLGFNLGMVQTAVFAGAAFGPAIGGFSSAHFGYRATFVISAGLLISAVIMVVSSSCRKSSPGKHRTTASAEGFGSRWAWMLGSMMLTMLTVLFMVRFVQMGIRPVMPLYLQELGHFTDTHAATVSGWMFGVLGVSSAASAIIFGPPRRQGRASEDPLLVRARRRAALPADGGRPERVAHDRAPGSVRDRGRRDDPLRQRDHRRCHAGRAARLHLSALRQPRARSARRLVRSCSRP